MPVRLRFFVTFLGAALGGTMLGGCVGTGSFLHDTSRLPGRNPNQPAGSSVNQQRVLLSSAQIPNAPPPASTEPGNPWPGPPKAVPSLQDLQRQQNEALANGTNVPHTMSSDLPQMPGYPVTPPEQTPPAPAATFPSGIVKGVEGKNIGSLTSPENRSVPAPNAKGDIVVPNGDGSSTVIHPDGSVTTLPKP